jgi:hypothetical protein
MTEMDFNFRIHTFLEFFRAMGGAAPEGWHWAGIPRDADLAQWIESPMD